MISKSMMSRITLVCASFFVVGSHQSLFAQKTTLKKLIPKLKKERRRPRFLRNLPDWNLNG